MSYKNYFARLCILLVSILSLSGCGGGGYNNENGGSNSTLGIWAVPANNTLTDAQVTKFNAGELYYNVHSSANPNGEIRGQIDTVKAVFSTFSSIPAILTGSQEVPAVTTNANAFGVVSVDPDSKKISGVVVTSGMNGTSAHIHDGRVGIEGPILITLTGGPTTWLIPDDTLLPDNDLAKLNTGGLYFNVHSAAFPDGEVRGQILDQSVKFAVLNGTNEVPLVNTGASGTGVLALDQATNNIKGFIKTTGISGTFAHIHSGAGIAVNLTETLPGSGVWMVLENAVLTDAQVTSFILGELYFNVHSTAFPNGEIRGQINSTGIGATITVKSTSLSGSKEVPSVATNAGGIGIATFNSDTKEIAGYVTTTGITGTVAHIHEGAAGVAGPIAIPLTKIAAGSIDTGFVTY